MKRRMSTSVGGQAQVRGPPCQPSPASLQTPDLAHDVWALGGQQVPEPVLLRVPVLLHALRSRVWWSGVHVRTCCIVTLSLTYVTLSVVWSQTTYQISA